MTRLGPLFYDRASLDKTMTLMSSFTSISTVEKLLAFSFVGQISGLGRVEADRAGLTHSTRTGRQVDGFPQALATKAGLL